MDKKLNVHEGHRQRLKNAVDNDAEMDSFSDHQVLEYLLSFLIPRKDTNQIAHELIDTFGNLYGVLSATSEELFSVRNMTKNASHLLPNITAIVRKAELSRIKNKTRINNIDDAVALLRPYFMNRNHEKLYIVCLDVNDRVIQVNCISEGLANFSTIDINKIMSIVTRTKTSKIIMAHNHPAGTLIPSQEDISCTSMLAITLNTIGTIVVDHIIFTTEGYFSFYQHDMMTEIFISGDKIFGTDYTHKVRCRRDVKKYVLEDSTKILEQACENNNSGDELK